MARRGKSATASTYEEPIATPDLHMRAIAIQYTNYRGETATRRVIPQRVWWGATDWHPEEQWVLEAFDVGRDAVRSFAVRDIHTWGLAPADVRD